MNTTQARPVRSAATSLAPSPLLRFALRLDAIATAASGLAMLPFAHELATRLQLPAALLAGAGMFMLVYAALVGWLAARATLPRWTVWSVIAGNAAWAAHCVVLALPGLLAPSALGIAFLLAQALVVAGFAALQYAGLQRAVRTAAA